MLLDGARVLADVGTDHAYLAIHLLKNGGVSRAVLTDVNEGPLLRAKRNVDDAGLTSRAELRLTDGARELSDCGADAYAICGMGGELIASIISDSPHLKDGNITLVLQPMSRPEALRAFLFSSGFEIEREVFVSEPDKSYVAMRARYTGRLTQADEGLLHFGDLCRQSPDDSAVREYFTRRRQALERKRAGLILGGEDASHESCLIARLDEFLNN